MPAPDKLVVVSNSEVIRQLLKTGFDERQVPVIAVDSLGAALAEVLNGLRPTAWLLVGSGGLDTAARLETLSRHQQPYAGYTHQEPVFVLGGQEEVEKAPSVSPRIEVIQSAGRPFGYVLRRVQRDLERVDDPSLASKADAATGIGDSYEKRSDVLRELNKARVFLARVVRLIEEQNLPGPMMPQLFQKARALLINPNVSIKKVAALVERHQALSARLLALCNSPIYFRGTPTTSVRQAVVRLGLRETEAVLQAVAALEYVVGGDESYRQLIRNSLKRSYLTALVAQHFAEKCRHFDASEVHTAGLLHNIGATFFFYTFALLRDQDAVKPIDPDALVQVAGQHFVSLNQMVCSGMSLPPLIATLFEQPEDFRFDTTRNLVCRASWVVERLLDEGVPALKIDPDAALLGLKQKDLDALEPQVSAMLAALNIYTA